MFKWLREKISFIVRRTTPRSDCSRRYWLMACGDEWTDDTSSLYHACMGLASILDPVSLSIIFNKFINKRQNGYVYSQEIRNLYNNNIGYYKTFVDSKEFKVDTETDCRAIFYGKFIRNLSETFKSEFTQNELEDLVSDFVWRNSVIDMAQYARSDFFTNSIIRAHFDKINQTKTQYEKQILEENGAYSKLVNSNYMKSCRNSIKIMLMMLDKQTPNDALLVSVFCEIMTAGAYTGDIPEIGLTANSRSIIILLASAYLQNNFHTKVNIPQSELILNLECLLDGRPLSFNQVNVYNGLFINNLLRFDIAFCNRKREF